jgi:hypothetical protein
MNVRFKRKLYTRGSSYETTIPIQMLFSSDLSKKQDVIFEYDKKNEKWTIQIEERISKNTKKKDNK